MFDALKTFISLEIFKGELNFKNNLCKTNGVRETNMSLNSTTHLK